MSTQVKITLLDGTLWEVKVDAKALRDVKGLPSGKVVRLHRRGEDVQTREVLLRPYYRRYIDGQLHIFAIQVMPQEENRHGK